LSDIMPVFFSCVVSDSRNIAMHEPEGEDFACA
jgi:hypothetical protein